ncbi:MAG: cation diffusion facilitator family transporter [Alphaproteobacteria bacterium]|nr:cation diffusion facilitator family transporter [Alphaproteobacteria bacterium]
MSTAWTKEKIEHYKKYAVSGSVGLSILLFLMKAFALLATGSLAILSSLVDSLSDIVASVVSFVAVKFSLKGASCSHRYGYFKAEHLSALVQAAFIAGSGFFVMYSGIDRFFHPILIKQTGIGIVVMALSLVLTLLLISFQKYVARHTHSMAVKADSAHYVVDVLTNISIILSLFVVKIFGVQWFDTLTAVMTALYLLIWAWKIAHEAVDALLDKELGDEVRKNVLNMLKQTEGIMGAHDLRTRDLGGIYYFEVHIEMDGNLSLLRAHQITESAEEKIKQAYPHAQVLIHQDPYGVKEERLDDLLKNCEV